MSNTYLDKFRSALPTSQGNQILKLLISKKDSGEIRTVDEFKTQLQKLTSEILAERITPTLKLFDAIPGADTSSAQYNEMLERIQDDLQTAFDEADNMDDIIAAHHSLINNVSLKALRYAVNELESKVSLYEFLNRSKKGFDDAQFNTFRESLNHQTSRSDTAAPLVFLDPRQGDPMDSDEDAQVDLIGERLILGASQNTYLSIQKAKWLSNSNSIRGELNASFKNSNTSNVVDGQDNTFWVVPVLLSSIRSSGVPMEVDLQLGAAQDVNFVEIEPATSFPMVLTGIDYYDAGNARRSISVSSVTLTGPTRVNFGRVTTRNLILRLRQDNYKEVQFKQKLGESNFHRAVLGESSSTVDMDSVSEDLQEMLTSDFILSTVMGVSTNSLGQKKYYEYQLGFDNIRAGFATFDDRSIYVSERKRVDSPGQISIRVEEQRPIQGADSFDVVLEDYEYPVSTTTEDGKFHHGVVEYWLVMQSFTSDDFLIATDTIPLFPLGATRVRHEQVIFTEATSGQTISNAGSLRLYTAADSSDVVVYRNGTALTYGTDWDFVSPSDPDVGTLTNATPSSGQSMKRGIYIVNGVNTLDIYTVSYTPVVSNTKTIPSDSTLLSVVDLIGDQSARVTDKNIVVLDEQKGSYTVSYADMYLVILMRRNSAKENFSPAVEEYMLVTGSRDTEKFSGD